MPLAFVFVYRENAMFARCIGEYVITVKKIDILLGSDGKNREHNIIKVDVSSINLAYLCIG